MLGMTRGHRGVTIIGGSFYKAMIFSEWVRRRE
jgi:hypothetical protein